MKESKWSWEKDGETYVLQVTKENGKFILNAFLYPKDSTILLDFEEGKMKLLENPIFRTPFDTEEEAVVLARRMALMSSL